MQNLKFKVLQTSLLALVIVLVTGCGTDDVENEGNHLPDVNIVENDKSVNVGAEVSLTAIAFDVDGDDLTYQWSFVSKPTDSTAELTTNTTTKSSFVADKEGEYKIKFISTDIFDAKGSDTVTITTKGDTAQVPSLSHSCTTYEELSSNVHEDTTLDGCYKVYGLVQVSAPLTVKAGSTVVFGSGAKLSINDEGELNAVGTATQPILFTGEEKIAGYWSGISFRASNHTNNEIAYATIEYAETGLEMRGNYGADNRLKLSNTTIQFSKYSGFNFPERSILDKFENVTSTKNGTVAGIVDMSVVAMLDRESDFTGNLGDDYIVVSGSGISVNSTWKKLSVPINITNHIGVDDDILLTLEAGSHIVFSDGAYISSGTKGGFKAVGTAKDPIIFTGKEKVAGYWQGVKMSSNNPNNILEHTIVEYATNGLIIYTHYAYSSGARVTAKDSIFRHNQEYGIYMDDDNEDAHYNEDIESANSFEDNALGNIGKS